MGQMRILSKRTADQFISTQEIALRYSVITHSTQFFASILRSHVWLRKAPEPVGQIVDCCTTGWIPSIWSSCSGSLPNHFLIRTELFTPKTNEGLQPVVQQSTICPTGSEALRSQTWLRKIDARSCVEWLITEYIDATSFVDFAKSYPASQSS